MGQPCSEQRLETGAGTAKSQDSTFQRRRRWERLGAAVGSCCVTNEPHTECSEPVRDALVSRSGVWEQLSAVSCCPTLPSSRQWRGYGLVWRTPLQLTPAPTGRTQFLDGCWTEGLSPLRAVGQRPPLVPGHVVLSHVAAHDMATCFLEASRPGRRESRCWWERELRPPQTDLGSEVPARFLCPVREKSDPLRPAPAEPGLNLA